MTEVIKGHLYDYPKYYDLLFGSDWKAEFGFLTDCFQQFASRPVRKLFEPACGTGRLLIKLAEAGFQVAGNDLNPRAVEYCNARLQRRGFNPTVFLGDMSDFRPPRKVDAAFNTINSFLHLLTDRQARNHLKCVAECLAKGGLYVLGLHLWPLQGERTDSESWSSRRGNLAVVSYLWSKGVDLRKRRERMGMTFDVYTLTKHFRIEDEFIYRTYTARQMKILLGKVPGLELVQTFDFGYEIDHPIRIGPRTQDVVYILRKI